MRKYETKQHKPSTYEALVEKTCDLCGMAAKTDNWDGSTYLINETEVTVEIKHEEGENYPENGCKTVYDIDLCPACFQNKLIPWMRSQGANIESKNFDW